MRKATFYLALFAGCLAEYSRNIYVWDGVSLSHDFFFMTGRGDYISWLASEPFQLTLDNVTYPLNTQYSFFFTLPGKYSYSLNQTATGIIHASSPQFFNNMTFEYDLQVNDIIRLNESEFIPPYIVPEFHISPITSPVVTFFDGVFDCLFVLPGRYVVRSMKTQIDYTFHVEDPDPSPDHMNFIWPQTNLQLVRIFPNLVRFYATEDRQLNVRVSRLVGGMPGSEVWVSPDLHRIGDTVAFQFEPGRYRASCDYDTSFNFDFMVMFKDSINHAFSWDGISTRREFHIMTGDTISWFHGSFLGSMALTVDNMTFPLSTEYSNTFDTPGQYSYTLSSGNQTASGLIDVKIARHFNNMTFEYDLQVNDIIRLTEGLNLFVYDFSSSGYISTLQPARQYSYTSVGYLVDLIFVVPGRYHSATSSNAPIYYFNVADPDPSVDHFNLEWPKSESANARLPELPAGVVRFYATEDRQLNVRVSRLVGGMPGSEVWVSPDLHRIGDTVAFQFEPGRYRASCDYDTSFNFDFMVAYPNSKHAMIPKSLVYVAEMSLFMIGLLGLGHFLLDQKPHDSKVLSLSLPPGDGGDEITAFAVDRSNERSEGHFSSHPVR
jgi:hypothetical protein